MKKLSLSLEELRVDSFDTTPAEQNPRGTVIAEQCSCPTVCSCPGCHTCDNTCPNTCATCDNTCPNTCATCGQTCEETCDDYTCLSCGETCANYGCTKYQPCIW